MRREGGSSRHCSAWSILLKVRQALSFQALDLLMGCYHYIGISMIPVSAAAIAGKGRDKMNNRLAAFSIVCLSTTLFSAQAVGQAYPAKPIRIATVDAGTPQDIVLRMMGNSLSSSLGQPIVVENKSINLHPEYATAKAAPDGYSLGYYANPLWMAPFMQEVPYDPLKDFSPI